MRVSRLILSMERFWYSYVHSVSSLYSTGSLQANILYIVEPLYSGHHIGEQNFVLYRGVVLSQGLMCTKRVHLGTQ